MLRIAMMATVMLAAFPAFAGTEAGPRLKAEVTITDPIVHIGDLIDHAGPLSDIAIFRAPDLGYTGTVLTRQVLDAVRPYGLEAVDTGGLAAVTVTRASRDIAAKDIADRIRQALVGQRGMTNAADIRLKTDQSLEALHVETTSTAPLQIARLSYSPVSRRFDVLLYVPDSDASRRMPLHLTGSAVETAEAVVLRRPLRPGDVIGPDDVVSERRPAYELGDGAIGRTAAAVGMAAQHTLRAGQVLHHGDLKKPELVQRGESVTLIYEVPGIVLTMRGKAVESGSQGDTIRVAIEESKRIVHGTVTGLRRVTVTAIPATAEKTASLR